MRSACSQLGPNYWHSPMTRSKHGTSPSGPDSSAGTTEEDSGTSEEELGSMPDLKPWRQLQDVSNKVPAVM